MTTLTPNFELLKMLANASDSQLDKSMCDHLKTLLDKPTEEVKDGLKYILDQSCNGGLASDFVMLVLDGEWKRLGGTL